MRLTANAHTHTSFCDGAASPAEMVRKALELGFTDLGFSGHSPIGEPNDWAMSTEGFTGYKQTVLKLKKEYDGVLSIALGTELDSGSDPALAAGLDYFIGSFHAFEIDGVRWDLDFMPERFKRCIDVCFGGDANACVRRFYELSACSALERHPDIIGHFDLIVKFNGDGRYFDEEALEYRRAAMDGLTAAMESEGIFEVNTNGVFCGLRREPYLAPFMLKYLAEHGGRVTVNNDAHKPEALGFYFDESLELLRASGFKSVWALSGGTFREFGI